MSMKVVARRLEKDQFLYRVDLRGKGETLFYYSNRRKRGTLLRPRASRVVSKTAATRIAVHWMNQRRVLAEGDSRVDNPQGGWKE